MCRKLTTEEFIEKAKSVHGYKYDYSSVNYVNNKTKVTLTCKEHGEFTQTPDHHINRAQGCPLCHQGYRDWDFVQPEDYKLIPLTQGKFAKVDNEDFDRFKDINWHVSTRNYVYNKKVGLIHRLILNPPDNTSVDHINNNPLDNRKQNLRICTQHQNTMNQSPQKGSSSKYKGVYRVTERRKWKAQIVCDGVHNSLGSFKTEQEAAKAYDKKALELFGEFAYLNFKS